jgi:hypothetical protein
MCRCITICLAKGVSINPKEIEVEKYKEMLVVTLKDAPEILDYGL